MDERVYDAMAEQSVVGSILLDPRCLPEVERSLRPEDLRLEADRALYRAALALEREGGKLDPVTILAQAQKSGTELSRQYVLELMEITPTAANVGEYITLASAREEKERADQEAARLERELTELKNRPVDVAVETVADPEAIAKARAEAVAEMQAKLDKAKAAKAKAEEKRKEAEAALEQVQAQLKDAEQARKNAVLSSDEDMATFKVLFQQAQEQANKMRGILLKLRNRPDGTAAQGAEKALKALAEAIGRCVE